MWCYMLCSSSLCSTIFVYVSPSILPLCFVISVTSSSSIVMLPYKERNFLYIPDLYPFLASTAENIPKNCLSVTSILSFTTTCKSNPEIVPKILSNYSILSFSNYIVQNMLKLAWLVFSLVAYINCSLIYKRMYYL